MIKSVTITNHIGESIKMELGFPEKSGFLIQNITGLGPVKADINSTKFATSDGSAFNSARLDSRNIVMTLRLLDNPTIEAMRQKSYKYFPIKKRIRFMIETDNRKCEIYGYVETNDPIIFSKKEITQISIICPDPYFYSIGKKTTIFSGLEPLFEFPFSNESLDGNLLEISRIITNQEKTIFYSGDADVGVSIFIHAIGEATHLTIYNSGTREVMKIDTDKLETFTGSGIISGDDIIISTLKGEKRIQLLRNGIYTSIINCIGKNTDWFTLAQGDNVFAFDAETGIANLQFRIENKTVYEGV